ncbi:MAG: hypothetical protein OEW75_17325 [Cyclobacteriaceae bacterium]|nr:hypothetical protein [Cyclobacteriaceae bacterium]
MLSFTASFLALCNRSRIHIHRSFSEVESTFTVALAEVSGAEREVMGNWWWKKDKTKKINHKSERCRKGGD